MNFIKLYIKGRASFSAVVLDKTVNSYYNIIYIRKGEVR